MVISACKRIKLTQVTSINCLSGSEMLVSDDVDVMFHPATFFSTKHSLSL